MAIWMREGLYKENSNEAKINILHISNALNNKVNIHRNIILQGLFGTYINNYKEMGPGRSYHITYYFLAYFRYG